MLREEAKHESALGSSRTVIIIMTGVKGLCMLSIMLFMVGAL